MPRTARIVVPGYPHHVVQRGHNRQVVFAERGDFYHYLDTLKEWKESYGVKVYGYCLMTNHIHLLLEPDSRLGLGGLMKRLAGRQTRHFNRQERRRGTLWEGRYKSSVVDTENYLLTCLKYVELNPVRAGMVEHAADYEWSSYRAHAAAGEEQGICDPIPSCPLPEVYPAFIEAGLSEDEAEFIRLSVSRNQLTGGNKFVEEIEGIVERRVERRGPGRPAKCKCSH